jgi:hypothetical protein
MLLSLLLICLSLTVLVQSVYWRKLHFNGQATALYAKHPTMGQVVLKVVPSDRPPGPVQVSTS